MRDYAWLVNKLRRSCAILVDGGKCEDCAGSRCMEIDAADAIEELLAKDTNVPNKWISVEERLPEIGKFVLVSDGDDIDAACRYKAFTVPDEVETFFWDSVLEVTHWMPLPEPPKEDAK